MSGIGKTSRTTLQKRAVEKNLAAASKDIEGYNSKEAADLQNQLTNFRPTVTPEMRQAMQTKAAPMPAAGGMSMDYLRSLIQTPQYGRAADQQWQDNRATVLPQIDEQALTAKARNDWLMQQTAQIQNTPLNKLGREAASNTMRTQMLDPNFMAQFARTAPTDEQRRLQMQQLRGGLLQG
jgi:hypothetical protein